ncbi:hypothetical protein J2W25_001606 [Variovorax boronicumulans]|uniref:Uncharacterized protein n=1 Tax=Variovorax boronicumulans TaxID=436515 RepID=A0AAW8DSR2_9BURK|nr:hypothetical protein [Variovorax boronicumulans]MDP9877299.1 hypothetical protein [Variovorax boronicumulans]MDP9922585.1 hypothetical protein [Variovorax boronicumulans]
MEHGEHCKRDLATLDELFMRWAPRGIDLPAPPARSRHAGSTAGESTGTAMVAQLVVILPVCAQATHRADDRFPEKNRHSRRIRNPHRHRRASPVAAAFANRRIHRDVVVPSSPSHGLFSTPRRIPSGFRRGCSAWRATSFVWSTLASDTRTRAFRTQEQIFVIRAANRNAKTRAYTVVQPDEGEPA